MRLTVKSTTGSSLQDGCHRCCPASSVSTPFSCEREEERHKCSFQELWKSERSSANFSRTLGERVVTVSCGKWGFWIVCVKVFSAYKALLHSARCRQSWIAACIVRWVIFLFPPHHHLASAACNVMAVLFGMASSWNRSWAHPLTQECLILVLQTLHVYSLLQVLWFAWMDGGFCRTEW